MIDLTLAGLATLELLPTDYIWNLCRLNLKPDQIAMHKMVLYETRSLSESLSCCAEPQHGQLRLQSKIYTTHDKTLV